MVLRLFLTLILASGAWGQAPKPRPPAKQLIVNFEYGTAYQSRPAQILSTIGAPIDAEVVTIRSRKDYAAFKQRSTAAYKEIILNINTHGSQQTSQMNHQIILEDGPVDFAEIGALTKKYVAAGKKVGLLDFSCFSGSDFDVLGELDKKSFCLITGDGLNQTAKSPFRNAFNDAYLASTGPISLEDMFLKARMAETFPASPSISTVQGLLLREKLRALNQLTSDTYDPVTYTSKIQSINCALTDTPSAPEELASDVAKILAFQQDMEEAEAMAFRKQLKEAAEGTEWYAKGRARLAKVLRELYGPDFDFDKFVRYHHDDYWNDFDLVTQKLKLGDLQSRLFGKLDIYITPAQESQLQALGLGPQLERLLEHEQRLRKLKESPSPEVQSDITYSLNMEVGLGEKVKLGAFEQKLYSRGYLKDQVPADHACKTLKFKKKAY